MAQKFRTKIVEIEATQWTGTNFLEMKEWTEGNFRLQKKRGREVESHGHVTRDPDYLVAQVYDKLHTTWINVSKGQWIVRGVKGEYYPCDDETFFWKYEPVDGLV
jgi:hypothetical protein